MEYSIYYNNEELEKAIKNNKIEGFIFNAHSFVDSYEFLKDLTNDDPKFIVSNDYEFFKTLAIENECSSLIEFQQLILENEGINTDIINHFLEFYNDENLNEFGLTPNS